MQVNPGSVVGAEYAEHWHTSTVAGNFTCPNPVPTATPLCSRTRSCWARVLLALTACAPSPRTPTA